MCVVMLRADMLCDLKSTRRSLLRAEVCEVAIGFGSCDLASMGRTQVSGPSQRQHVRQAPVRRGGEFSHCSGAGQ